MLILLLSSPVITENLKIWPDLASLAAHVFSLTLCIIFFSLQPSTLLHKVFLSLRSHTNIRITEVHIDQPYTELIPVLTRVHPELFMWLSVSHHSSEPGPEKMAQTEDTRREATALTRVTPRDRYLTQDQSGPFLPSDNWEYSSINPDQAMKLRHFYQTN